MNPRPTIAACMIVRNGSATIEPCIESVRPHVDQIVIYLGGESTDNTVEILARLAAEPGPPVIVQQGVWNDDYAEARNRSFEMASCEYVIWFDDDEPILIIGEPGTIPWPGRGYRLDKFVLRNPRDLLLHMSNGAVVKFPASPAALADDSDGPGSESD